MYLVWSGRQRSRVLLAVAVVVFSGGRGTSTRLGLDATVELPDVHAAVAVNH
jgi:hypothetical protein